MFENLDVLIADRKDGAREIVKLIFYIFRDDVVMIRVSEGCSRLLSGCMNRDEMIEFIDCRSRISRQNIENNVQSRIHNLVPYSSFIILVYFFSELFILFSTSPLITQL